MTAALGAALCMLAPVSEGLAQPDMENFPLEPIGVPPEFLAPKDPVFLAPKGPVVKFPNLGEKDPIPAPSDQDITLSLEVFRSGEKDTKAGLMTSKGRDYWRSDSQTTWSYGPYKLNAKLYANGEKRHSNGRNAILAALGQWQQSRQHYLQVLASFAAAGSSNIPTPPRQAYYAMIASEVRHVLEAARLAAQDVAFLKSLLERQRAYTLGNKKFFYGPVDERSPVTAQVTFDGGQSTIRERRTRVYFGQIDGQTDNTRNEVIKPNTFEVTPGDREDSYYLPGADRPPYRFVPNVTLELMDLAGCEADQLSIILAGFNKRLAALTPKDASGFSFNEQQREWYSETTRPVLVRMFRESYRQAVYEAVRYAWSFSGQTMPRDMQLGAASDASQAIDWHPAYQDPAAPQFWVDAIGVPIIRDGAQLRLPAGLDGRHLKLFIPEAGGTPPTDLETLTSYNGFTSRTISKQLTPGVRHTLMTWLPYNKQDRVDTPRSNGIRLGSFELQSIEPAWTGYYTNSMQKDAAIFGEHLEQIDNRLFAPAPGRVDPAEESGEFSKAPRMHLLHAVNSDGALDATLTIHYDRTITDPDSLDIDLGSQDVKIAIKVAAVSTAPLPQVCPDPVFETPPELRLVQFWENKQDTPKDDAFLPAETIWPGHPYFVEAAFEEAPPADSYHVKVDEARSIRVTRTRGDAALYRSELVTFAPRQPAP
jgi:hypothetical protein